MDDILLKAFQEIEGEFHVNELAYLALTTKIELPFRDRLAFYLYKYLEAKGIKVSREWHRTDLAFLKEREPLALIELKANYTFDVVLKDEKLMEYIDAMEKDEQKAEKLANENTSIYTILLTTHPEKRIEKSLKNIVKYNSGINRAFKKYESASAIKVEATQNVSKALLNKKILCSGEIDGGEAFGIKTSVLYWVVKYLEK